MALDYAQGSILWLQASTVGTTYTVSGLSFQPKALRFEYMGIEQDVDTVTEDQSLNRGIGLATSTSSRRCLATASEDGSGSAVCASMVRNDSVAVGINQVDGSLNGTLDLNSITSDGFQLIVDDQLSVAFGDMAVLWKAWGGSDITNVTVGDFAEPAATGTQNYTATGFTTAGTDQAVMLAGVQATTINTGLADSSTLSIGYATSSASANNINLIGMSDDGSATMDTYGACYTGECVAMIVPQGLSDKNARATLSAFGTDLFTLDWLERTTTGRLSIYMAIKGGHWTAGSYTIDGSTGSATATVSGLSYAPIGLLLMGRMSVVQALDTVEAANDRMSWGSGTSTSNRHSMGGLDEDATANAEINQTIQYDQVLAFPSTTGTLQSAYDINAMNSDGFQIIVDTAGGVASEWQGYLAFGSTAVAVLPPRPTVVLQAVPHSSSW